MSINTARKISWINLDVHTETGSDHILKTGSGSDLSSKPGSIYPAGSATLVSCRLTCHYLLHRLAKIDNKTQKTLVGIKCFLTFTFLEVDCKTFSKARQKFCSLTLIVLGLNTPWLYGGWAMFLF